ncbi:MAG: glycoside hydrolase family 3 protein [Lachnospiraceae bacterium]|nr:glycoside hydrolase family 3 protein [Lachnospiraceae bacterium]
MEATKTKYSADGMARLARKAAAEGIVLLKNENNVLPFDENETISVFGRCQLEYYRSGTGSGGAVNVAYTTNLADGLKNSNKVKLNEELYNTYKNWIKENPFDNGGGGWAAEPWCQKEMPVSYEMAAEAAKKSSKAVVVIGRTAGEDKDNKAEEGSFYLTGEELSMLQNVVNAFENVIVVLNVGNIIDMSFLQTLSYAFRIKAVLYAWHGGMEGGNATADVMTGKVMAQGKLSDTIARSIEDYPSNVNHGGDLKNIYQEDIYVGYRYFETFDKNAVMFPFGFGLSYTDFEIAPGECYTRLRNDKPELVIEGMVNNKGTKYSGREVIQIYAEGPQTKLGRPAKVLVGFKKTGVIPPGGSEEFEILIPFSALSVFDDTGITGHPNCYVVEKGDYVFHIGNSVRDTKVMLVDSRAKYHIGETEVVEKLNEAMAPIESFKRMCPGEKKTDGTYTLEYENVSLKKNFLRDRVLGNLPEVIEYTGDKGYVLKDVADGKCTLDEFVAQLSNEDMATLVRGEGMCNVKVTPGTASAFGGVSDRLLDFGIPIACCADGPSGVRMDGGFKATQLPIGTALACTWDPDLVEKLFTMQGKEILINNIDTLLGPGMNIHRHPLNGRNFEYYSEDPLITGKMAAATVRGIDKNGVFATIKHMALNSQEHNRRKIEAVVSQRAIREIYLKGFEIAVKEGNAKSIMTSYNPINGYWSASNYDMTTTILREEWGYDGLVMTDWWATMNGAIDRGEDSVKHTADMIRSQNDVYMVVSNNGAELNVNGDDTIQALEEGRLTVGELQRCAKNICRFLLNTPSLKRVGSLRNQIPFMASEKTGEAGVQEIAKTPRVELGNAKEPTDRWFYCDRERIVNVVVKIMYDHSNIAQTVCKASLNGKELNIFQTNGTDGNWIYQKLLRVRLEEGWYHLELEFPKPGMQVAYMEFVSEN